MSYQSSSPISGIQGNELQEVLPESLDSKRIHLYWIEMASEGEEQAALTAKIGVNDQVVLLKSLTRETEIIHRWDNSSETGSVDARLLALDRILTDPLHEDTLMAL